MINDRVHTHTLLWIANIVKCLWKLFFFIFCETRFRRKCETLYNDNYIFDLNNNNKKQKRTKRNKNN